MILWLQLLLCLAVIGFAGWHLSRNGDIIAEKTGMSASLVGLILLATATSLPELITGLSAVTVANVPDIAVGDVLGSAVFNLAILVVLDALYRRESIYSRAAQGHILSAALGALLLAFAAFSILLDRNGASPALGHIGLYTPVIVVMYLMSMRVIYQYEQRTVAAFTEARRHPAACRGRLSYGGIGGGGGRFLATLRRYGHFRTDGMGAKLRRHYSGGGCHLRAGSRCHAIGATHGRHRHGHRQSVGQQPVQYRDPCRR